MLERRRTVTPEQVYAQQAERDIKRRKEADLRRAQELAKKAMAGDDRAAIVQTGKLMLSVTKHRLKRLIYFHLRQNPAMR